MNRLTRYTAVAWPLSLWVVHARGLENDDNDTPSEESLQLRYVAMVTRHGYRTPLSVPGSYTEEWQCSNKHLTLTYSQHPHEDSGGHHLPTNQLYMQQALPSESDRPSLPGSCYFGQLTEGGRQQMGRVGEALRARYVQEKEGPTRPTHFLPHVMRPTDIYLRSTDIKRTLETAQCIMDNLYPSEKRPSGEEGILTIHSRDRKHENMYGRSSCAALSVLKKAVKNSPAYAEFQEQFQPLRQIFQENWKREISSWAGMYNTYECMKGSGLRLPEFMTEEVQQQLKEAAGREMMFSFATPQICSLSIGRFVKDVLNHMEEFVAAPLRTPRFALYSGHDNTLSPMLSGLRIVDGYHPPMGSNLLFELWERGQSGQYYVRTLYNGQVTRLPGCEDFVPLQRFQEIAGTLVPTDYEAQCQVE